MNKTCLVLVAGRFPLVDANGSIVLFPTLAAATAHCDEYEIDNPTIVDTVIATHALVERSDLNAAIQLIENEWPPGTYPSPVGPGTVIDLLTRLRAALDA